jgi:DnaJ-class molecular chaperone
MSDRETECPECLGTGTTGLHDEPDFAEPCWACGGTGEVRAAAAMAKEEV